MAKTIFIGFMVAFFVAGCDIKQDYVCRERLFGQSHSEGMRVSKAGLSFGNEDYKFCKKYSVISYYVKEGLHKELCPNDMLFYAAFDEVANSLVIKGSISLGVYECKPVKD